MTLRNGTPQLYSEEPSPAQSAAILHSAGFTQAAIDSLKAEIASPSGALVRESWMVLCDLYHLAGLREEFDALAASYGAAFPECARPSWGFPPTINAAGTLVLEGVLDTASKCLAQVAQHGAGRRTMAFDMSRVERISFPLLGDLASVLRAFHLQGKRLFLANISELNCALLESVGVDQYAVFMRRKDSEGKVRRLAVPVRAAQAEHALEMAEAA